MGNKEKKRIGVSHLIPGMILAEDIYTPKGLMLIPENTTIDEKHIFRIRLYQIHAVSIFPETDLEEVYTAPVSKPEFTVTKSFTEFRERYKTQQQETEKVLNAILEGKEIQEEKLLDVPMALIESLRNKSELFHYLHHLKNNSEYNYTHSLNVAVLANIFAQWLKLSAEEVKDLTLAGLLHDIGKIRIDPNLLNKPGKLTPEEFNQIKLHTTFGYESVQLQDINNDVKNAVLLHHEKIDGSGYPLGLKDDQIPLYAKIICIIDIYDAMTSERSYHSKFSPFKVIRMFEEESYGILDTKLLFVFLENIAHNYLGKDVLLSTGERGRIVFIHNQSPSRPIIQVNENMIDLMTQPSIDIEAIL